MPSFALDGSRIRITIFSPNSVGSVLTRKSIALAPNFSFMRPSCGTRFSAMSSREITLMREDELVLDRDRRLRDLAQLAVDAEAHAVVVLVGLEVQVRGAHVDRVDQHLVQEAHDRRVLDLGRRPPALFGGRRDIVGDVELEVAGRSAPPSSRWRWRRWLSSIFASLSCSTMTHSGASCVANLMRSTASWSVGSAPPTKMRLPRLPSTTTWYCAASLVSMMSRGSRCTSTAVRSSSGSAERGGQRVREVGRGDGAGRDHRGDEAGCACPATCLHEFLGGLAASLPACTSTRATPERAECGASASVSTRQALELHVVESDDHRRFTGAL